MRTHSLMFIIPATCLLACSQQPKARAPAPPVAAAATVPPESLPAPKAGLWRSVTVTDGQAPETADTCLKGYRFDPAREGPGCEVFSVSRTADGGFAFAGDCTTAGVVTRKRMVTTGDYDRAYVTEFVSTRLGDDGPAAVSRSRATWTFVGRCPAA